MSNLSKITFATLFIILAIAAGVSFYLGLFDMYMVKGVLKGGKNAVEQKDIDRLMSYVSLRYMDDNGFNYSMAKRFMSGLFKDFERFEVVIEEPVIKIKDDMATVQFYLWVAVDWGDKPAYPAYIVGTNHSAAAVHAYLKKEFLRWKVVKIEGVR